MAQTTARQMKAYRDGRCCLCVSPIRKGDQIWYDPEKPLIRQRYHVRCPTPPLEVEVTLRTKVLLNETVSEYRNGDWVISEDTDIYEGPLKTIAFQDAMANRLRRRIEEGFDMRSDVDHRLPTLMKVWGIRHKNLKDPVTNDWYTLTTRSVVTVVLIEV